MELTPNDKAYIKTIATTHNLDEDIVKKNYTEMLTKTKHYMKFKEIVAKIKNIQTNKQ